MPQSNEDLAKEIRRLNLLVDALAIQVTVNEIMTVSLAQISGVKRETVVKATENMVAAYTSKHGPIGTAPTEDIFKEILGLLDELHKGKHVKFTA